MKAKDVRKMRLWTFSFYIGKAYHSFLVQLVQTRLDLSQRNILFFSFFSLILVPHKAERKLHPISSRHSRAGASPPPPPTTFSPILIYFLYFFIPYILFALFPPETQEIFTHTHTSFFFLVFGFLVFVWLRNNYKTIYFIPTSFIYVYI